MTAGSSRAKTITCRAGPALVLASVLLLCGCKQASLPNQLLVAGDKFEVTLSEFEQVLQAAPPVRKEEVAPARRSLLDLLIAQKLLAEAGEAGGVERRPDVMQQIAAARRAIVAEAYIRQLVGERQPSDAEIARYYDRHPELFADRAEIVFHEFALPADAPKLDHYVEVLNRRGFDALAAELATAMPSLAPADRTLLSSELPAGARKAAAALKVGSDASYSTPSALHLGRVTAVRSSPLSLADARTRIAALMQQERRATLVTAEVANLRRSRHVRIVNADLATGTTP